MIEKAVTVCDVITLDRAVRKNVVSVVYFVQRIDPAETDADSEKLRKLLYTFEQSARSKDHEVIDESSRRSCRLTAWARRYFGTWWYVKGYLLRRLSFHYLNNLVHKARCMGARIQGGD